MTPMAPGADRRAPRFSARTLAFLRALKRNNDRGWFKARREEYDLHVRAPMIALIEALAVDFRSFAPELVADPKVSLYRIYRDTRFAADKAPLKTHVAAMFPHRGLGRHAGAGLYLHVAPNEVWIGGGLYAPTTEGLHLVREAIARHPTRFRRIVEAKGFRDAVGALSGERLQRMPRGFAQDHPAGEYLKYRQFLAGREYPASLATSPRFYTEVRRIFRQVVPLIRFLNDPLAGPAGARLRAGQMPALRERPQRDR